MLPAILKILTPTLIKTIIKYVTEENELVEKIAKLLDKYLDTEIDDLTNIQEMVDLEKVEARLLQARQNNLNEVNGGSK